MYIKQLPSGYASMYTLTHTQITAIMQGFTGNNYRQLAITHNLQFDIEVYDILHTHKHPYTRPQTYKSTKHRPNHTYAPKNLHHAVRMA